MSVKGRSDWKNLSKDADTQVSAGSFDTFTNINKVNALRLSALLQENQTLIQAAYQLDQNFVFKRKHKFVALNEFSML